MSRPAPIVLCPVCEARAISRGGGGLNANSQKRCYYGCPECGIRFELLNGATRVLEDGPLPFRDRAEALRSLYQSVKEDREWFDEVSPETIALGREVFVKYLIGNRKRQPLKPGQQAVFKRGEGRRMLGER